MSRSAPVNETGRTPPLRIVERVAGDMQVELPAVERTPVAGVLRVRSSEAAWLDIANLRGQPASDGYISWDDAAAHAVPLEEWKNLLVQPVDSATFLESLITIFGRHSKEPPPVTLRFPGGVELKVPARRAQELISALARIRARIDGARARGLTIVYPVQREGRYRAGDSSSPGTYAVDPAKYSRLRMSADEERWLFGTLNAKTERVVLSGGRAHYMSPEVKAALDAHVQRLFSQVMEARAAGKKALYVSTAISAGDLATNTAIARFVEERVVATGPWAGNVFVVNPASHQGICPNGSGDDFMYMWEQLLNMNIFDAVRFTSASDAAAYFAAAGKRVPKEYVLEAGDIIRSSGCRYEWNIFARINRDYARQGKARSQVPFYYGDQPVPLPLITSIIDEDGYHALG